MRLEEGEQTGAEQHKRQRVQQPQRLVQRKADNVPHVAHQEETQPENEVLSSWTSKRTVSDCEHVQMARALALGSSLESSMKMSPNSEKQRPAAMKVAYSGCASSSRCGELPSLDESATSATSVVISNIAIGITCEQTAKQTV